MLNPMPGYSGLDLLTIDFVVGAGWNGGRKGGGMIRTRTSDR